MAYGFFSFRHRHLFIATIFFATLLVIYSGIHIRLPAAQPTPFGPERLAASSNLLDKFSPIIHSTRGIPYPYPVSISDFLSGVSIQLDGQTILHHPSPTALVGWLKGRTIDKDLRLTPDDREAMASPQRAETAWDCAVRDGWPIYGRVWKPNTSVPDRVSLQYYKCVRRTCMLKKNLGNLIAKFLRSLC